MTDTIPSLDIRKRCQKIIHFLEDRKAEDVLTIDLYRKSSLADYMILASGTSARHVQSMAELLKAHLHEEGVKEVYMSGKEQGDWVAIDANEVIVHLFRPEVRSFYNLEKLWDTSFDDFEESIMSKKID